MMPLALVNQSTEGKDRGALPPRTNLPRRMPWRFSLGCLALLGFFYAVAWRGGAGPSEPLSGSPSAAPPPAWVEIQDPAEVFRLEAPELAEAARSYAALRHRTSGGRQDILEFRGSESTAPSFFRLVAYRPGGEAVFPQSFFVELARRAADAGLAITRAAQPNALATRFGAFEVAELSFVRSGAPAKECLGFRFNSTEPDLRITGFACGPGGFALSKSALACLLNRIDLAPAPEDESLVFFFAAHEITDSPACPETTAQGLRGMSR
ncbi:MAG: hypothetical protein L0Y50_04300 [Beijerinckiaceae bacterium]|nr:hypothetical protein [Beijerinckiaceae bacterium]